MKEFAFVAAVALLCCTAGAELKTRGIEYEVGGQTFEGYLAYDDQFQDKRPGVLVVHEWWGLTDYPKRRAEQLAQLGYVAYAADMYGKGRVTESPQEAAKLAGEMRNTPEEALKRLNAALEVLRRQPDVNADDMAAIGYCFGGGMVLNLARSGADIDGVISFHGGLSTDRPAREGVVKASVLVLTGAADPTVPMQQVMNFIDEMQKANADFQVNIYADAKHAFTNPAADKYNMPQVAYDEQADKRSWAAMKIFLAEIFERAGANE